MCNLYKMMMMRAEVAALARAMYRPTHNAPPGAVYPDYAAPVVMRDETGQRVMHDLRWGMPSSSQALYEAASKRADKLRAKGKALTDDDFKELVRMEPDSGTTNIRNTKSKHWTRWLGPANRCLVPFTSFSEPDQVGGSKRPIWFDLGEDQPLAYFAGVHTAWSCVRKIKTGWEDCNLYGFLTTDANAEVGRYHSKAMPVILTTEAECDLWLSDAPWPDVAHLQRPLPDGSLRVDASALEPA